LLGQYLGLEPAHLRFCYGPQGKPTLESSADSVSVVSTVVSTVQFNLSHSQGLALYAITRQAPIGIDLEYCQPLELDTIAKSYFSSREYAQLSALPPWEQRTAFFQLWTCKEAYLKATGQGLSGLEDAELSFQCNQPILKTTGTECWQLQSLIPAPRYIAAWAVARQSWAVQFYNLDL
jgi:4'-phosphopantetheinyl transferase